jgi:hypothetical protein
VLQLVFLAAVAAAIAAVVAVVAVVVAAAAAAAAVVVEQQAVAVLMLVVELHENFVQHLPYIVYNRRHHWHISYKFIMIVSTIYITDNLLLSCIMCILYSTISIMSTT